MFFNSLSFIFLFLPIVLGCYFLSAGKKTGQIILTVASLVFYFLLIPEYLPLLLLSITFNYSIGYFLFRTKQASGQRSLLQLILFIGILGDLGLLGYYKYLNFAIFNLDQFFGLSLPTQSILLPLGISFFTFTQIAFIVDTYRGNVDRINPLSYLQFVTFFPHLIAGPIYHHAEIIPQMEDETRCRLDWANINLGFFFFFFGLAKKVIIADSLATIATPIFSAVAQGGTPMLFEAWFGVLAYTLQLYFDFSGYCDMAIGLALMFNIRFPLNFFSPYRVTSIIDFWRCWNITLSNFLRDYIYIPLGGNRYGLPEQIRNLLITMLLGGLWHGAAWTFVIWGALHGIYLTVNHLWRRTGIILHSFICWLATFLAVIIGWVFFRADSISSAIKILKGMFGLNGISVPSSFSGPGMFMPSGFTPLSNVDPLFAGAGIALALGIVLALPNLYDMTREYRTALVCDKQRKIRRIDPFNIEITYVISVRWCVILAIVAACAIISIQTTSEFLYFQF